MELSVIIPIHNEEENIVPMYEALVQSLDGLQFEVIFVDDGSTDKSVEKILEITDPRIRLVRFIRNFGQTSAMSAGITEAQGAYIVTMDGDLQNDPADIPRMLEKIYNDKLDIVMGRRANRKDGFVLRKIPSKIANYLIRKLSKVYISDYGCTLKIFKHEMAKSLDLYGELHRFIPILATINGAKMAEMDVRHHPRQFGTSKYGVGRTFRVLSDLLLMLFMLKYRQKPMHLFGSIGIWMFVMGGLIEAYLLVEKVLGNDIGGRPLFYIGILLLIMSVQFVTVGFLSELIMRTYFESQNKKPYIVAEQYRGGKLEQRWSAS